jgi:tRNA 2-selenouridine synthase
VIDVRSPSEFSNGHIPGSINIPLFSDEERIVVGTKYTKESRYSSIIAGLDFVGPKLSLIVKEANRISPSRNILIYCWRGGMRSASVSWLLNLAGFKTKTLIGGYKSYRRFLRGVFGTPLKLIVVGGMTGSGKTELLRNLTTLNEQVIDLEEIANHKGSAFGAIGQQLQPSTEQFENLLFEKLLTLNFKKRIWVEDESKGIGSIFIPDELFYQMVSSPCVVVEIPFETRVMRLVNEYTKCDPLLLVNGIDRITKKLGPDNTQLAKQAVLDGDFKTAVEIVLFYYDKAYRFGVESKKNKIHLPRFGSDYHLKNARALIKEIDKIIPLTD